MKIKETRVIRFESVRYMCIKNDLYTCGTNEEYSNMLLNLCSNENEITVDRLFIIAKDIKEHSYTEMDITDIMFLLGNDCCEYFYNEVE